MFEVTNFTFIVHDWKLYVAASLWDSKHLTYRGTIPRLNEWNSHGAYTTSAWSTIPWTTCGTFQPRCWLVPNVLRYTLVALIWGSLVRRSAILSFITRIDDSSLFGVSLPGLVSHEMSNPPRCPPRKFRLNTGLILQHDLRQIPLCNRYQCRRMEMVGQYRGRPNSIILQSCWQNGDLFIITLILTVYQSPYLRQNKHRCD